MELKYTMPLSSEAVYYTWRQLAQRVGIVFDVNAQNPFAELGIPVFHGHPEDARFERSGLIIARCDEFAPGRVLNAASNSLQWLNAVDVFPAGTSLPFQTSIPVLFWGDGFESGEKPFAELRADGTLVFYADILSAAFFMLSRWEETVIQDRDEHGRFPSQASTASKQGFLHLPIVDQYTLVLRAWLQMLLPVWLPARNQFTIKLSHDIDHVSHFNTMADVLLKAAGDVINRRNIAQALRTLNTGIAELRRPSQGEMYQGVVHLAQLSRQHQMPSAFYFKASSRTPYDSGYRPDWKWVRQLVSQLRKDGFEIGFHPGYRTFNDLHALQMEKRTFEQAFGVKRYGGRQHYLRFKVPTTWNHWAEAGLDYDSSMMFSDRNGFRCGTCHPFAPFDVQRNVQLNLIEIPLIVMDVTFTKNRITSEQARVEILQLARFCQEVEGTFTLLWHNTSLYGEWAPWLAMYETVLPELAAMRKSNVIDE